MKKSSRWFYPGLGVISLLVLTVLLWALPVGATHIDPDTGTVTATNVNGATAVSPDNSVDVADRVITITVTDSNLNTPLAVSGEALTIQGAQLPQVPDGVDVGNIVLKLANAMTDRDDDGDIDSDDIVIDDDDLDDDDTADIQVQPIDAADVAAQIVRFRILTPDHSGEAFAVSYATPGAELARGKKEFTETLAVPDGGVSSGDEFTLDLDIVNLPVQATGDDGVITLGEITISLPDGPASNTVEITDLGDTANVGDAAKGLPAGVTITIKATSGDLVADTAVKLVYVGLEDLVTVRVDNGDPIALRLSETGADTGVFTTTVIVVNGEGNVVDDANPGALNPPANLDPTITDSDERPRLAVLEGAGIIVTYKDQSPNIDQVARVGVEPGAPTFSNISPAADTATNNLSTVLSVQVDDSIAGVNPAKYGSGEAETSITVLITEGGDVQAVSSGDITVTETPAGSGVYVVEYNINNIADIAAAIEDGTDIVTAVTWQVVARDNAGNEGETDELTLNVDNSPPTFDGAIAGANPDPAATDLRTSIRMNFSDAMDPDSLQASDFEVAGVAPTAVDHFAATADAVFLTVAEMAPDATPTVEIVGEVKDAGGNALSSASVTASDGMAPGLTAALSSDYNDGSLTLTVVSDELIAGSLPGRTVKTCAGDPVDCDVNAVGFNTTSRIVRGQLEWTFDLSGFGDGRFSIILTAQDSEGNAVQAGNEDPTADDAIDFEVDTAMPAAFTSTPEDGEDAASDADPFIIEISLTDEGDEYDGDSHSAVTLTKADLDGTDVLPLSSTKDDANFSIVVSDVGLGEHTLTFSAEDGAGNAQEDLTITFTVVAPPAFDLELLPGMNLISLPGEPENTAIDAVFGGTEQVGLVFTRSLEGESELPWLVAVRDSSGSFSGNLTTIDAKHAYWVKVSATVSVSIDIPPLGAQSVPPTIAVKANVWNLVPVISLLPLGDVPQFTTLDEDDYLGAGTWSRAWTFDRGQWHAINPGGAAPTPGIGATASDGVQIGRGYWVLFTTDGIITPGTPVLAD